MATFDLERVFSHWNKLFETFTASSQAFYASVEKACEHRAIPGVHVSRVSLMQDLVTSREYLRVERGDVVIDICAAPFGPNYFFSTWLWRRSNYAGSIAILSGLLILESLWFFKMGQPSFGRFLLWLVFVGVSVILVRLFHRWYNRVTYYKIDAMLMFQKTVHSAVLEAIDGMTTARGIRSLSDEERKPVYRELGR